MTTQPPTGEQLADIRARHSAATGGTWYPQPNHGPHFIAAEHHGYEHGIGDLNFGDGDQADADREFVLHAHTDIAQLFAENARLRAELAAARERLASYGSPLFGPVPLPPEDEGRIKQAAKREELERTGVTDQAWAVGRGLCPEKSSCPSGLMAVFELTKRGRLPVHRGDYGPACDGSGRKPSVVLRFAEQPADGPSTTA